MFRPLEPTKKSKVTRRQLADEEVSAGTPLMVRIKRERDEKLRNDEQLETMNQQQQQQTDHFHSSTNSLNNTVKLVGIKAKRSSTLTDSASSLGKKETPLLLAAAGSKRSLANQDEVQPLNRDDAFYTGSLQRLPQYRENPNSYHASVTRVLLLFID